jgi:predicted RNase H-like HicB family nuclease
MSYRYSPIIQWSDEDQLYLVTIPEFSNIAIQPCTYGKTYEDAIANAQEADRWLLGLLPGGRIFAPTACSCSRLNTSDRLSKMRTRSLTE